MDMTISVFDAYFMRMQATRIYRMMDMSHSTLYAQLTNEGRRSTWNSWTRTISQITHFMSVELRRTAKSTITWNGQETTWKNVKNKFRSMFGRRAVE